MNSQSKQCQNCKSDFTIESEDFAFYERIKVPPPTFCPDCRRQRRMAWRNERSIYRASCCLCGKAILTMYPEESGVQSTCRECWWSDSWDPLSYGADYNPDKTFFAQFSELAKRAPSLALSNVDCVDSDYSNFTAYNKNCYLVFGSGFNENVRYSRALRCRDSQDLFVGNSCELCYECTNCSDSYRLLFSYNSENCSDSYFLYNCRNCSNCLGCINLVDKSYCIFNQQYSKEEYSKKIAELELGKYSSLLNLEDKIKKEVVLKGIHKFANIVASSQTTGDNIRNSQNCHFCFDTLEDVQNCKYLYYCTELKDSYDGIGQYRMELGYENVDCNVSSSVLGGITIYDSNNIRYSKNCHNCSNLFGCVNLRKKQYCILNKQYSKEEYERLISEIIGQMNSNPYLDSKGRKHAYGDFYPIELSPFPYNQTIAQEYAFLDKGLALTNGYKWEEHNDKNYETDLTSLDLPDTIADVSDKILNQVIQCEHLGTCGEQCTTAFKIIPGELQFYRKMNLPLPRLCHNCRHYKRLRQRNPLKLWSRKCQCAGQKSENGIYQNTIAHPHGTDRCSNEFQTSYSPDRPEIVYCENCYQAEIV